MSETMKQNLLTGVTFSSDSKSPIHSGTPSSASAQKVPSEFTTPQSHSRSINDIKDKMTLTSSALGPILSEDSDDGFMPRRSLQAVVIENFSSSVRGFENFHIYLWILKDFAWAQDSYWLAVIFGSAAVIYCGLLLYMAVCNRDIEETYMIIALTLWLFGNYWWMAGEVGIHGDDDSNSPETAQILIAALCWLGLYYVVLRPMGWITVSSKMLQRYKQTGLKSRFSYFITWRQYEHAHTLFWLGKDLSWNRLEPISWVFFSIPTILIAFDFIWVTWRKGQIVDSAHYTAQLIWVLANLTWAGGEIFYPLYDDPIPVTTRNATAYQTCRWWSSILLILAFVPISLLYFIYFPLKTCEAEKLRLRNLSFTNGSDDELLDEKGRCNVDSVETGGQNGSGPGNSGESSPIASGGGNNVDTAVIKGGSMSGSKVASRNGGSGSNLNL